MDQGQRTPGPAAPGRLDAAFLLAIDRRLAEADRLLATRYPGDAGSRQPTAHRLCAGGPDGLRHPGTVGGGGLDCWTRPFRTRAARSGSPASAASTRTCTTGCWPSWPASRSRTCGSTSRTATAPGRTSEEDAARRRRRRGARRRSPRPDRARRSSASGSSRWRRPPAAAACGRWTCSLGALLDGGRCRTAGVVTLPKVTSVDQVAGDGRGLRAAGAGVRAARRRACGSRSRWRPRRRSSAPTAPPRSRRCSHAAGGRLHRRCTTAPTTTPPRCGISGGAPGHGPSGRRPRQGRDAARRGGHRRPAVATARPTSLPVGDRDEVHAAWALHARLVRRSLERGFYQGWDLHPGPAARPASSATYVFFREGLERPRARLAPTCTAGRRRCWTSRPPRRPWPLPDARRALRRGRRRRGGTSATGLYRPALDALARRRPLPGVERSTRMTTIAFIGLGIMGSPMAVHLPGRRPSTSSATTAPRTRPSRSSTPAAGAAPRSPRRSRDAEVVAVMVPDSPDVAGGARRRGRRLRQRQARHAGHRLLQHPPRRHRRARRSRRRSKGFRLLDAPVSGGEAGAKNAALSIMVGGDGRGLRRGQADPRRRRQDRRARRAATAPGRPSRPPTS